MEKDLNYLQNKQNEPTPKIPRQTVWNRRNKNKNTQNQNFGLSEFLPNSTNNESNNISVVDGDSVNLVDESILFERELVSGEFGEESIIDDDNEQSPFESAFNNISCTLNETNIETDNDENENDICVDYLIKIHENLECTVMDVLSMVYAYSVRHNLNWTAVEDLIHLVNAVTGRDSLPSSKYMFKKMFKPKENSASVFHFWCHVCEKYLGVKDDFVDVVELLLTPNIKKIIS